jgi:hypothetical protein
MLRVITWMIKLPTSLIGTGIEIFTKAFAEVQNLMAEGLDLFAGSIRDSVIVSGPSSTTSQHDTGNTSSAAIFHKEDEMSDQDLGGDDLKYVSYSVLFTKRDYEATLEEQKEFLVNYATDGASFASLKMIQFADNPFRRPPQWMSTDSLYPPGINQNQTEIKVKDIPPDDQKYLTFIYNVERRLPKQSREYDRDQVRALKGIQHEIGGISGKIGPG